MAVTTARTGKEKIIKVFELVEICVLKDMKDSNEACCSTASESVETTTCIRLHRTHEKLRHMESIDILLVRIRHW